MTLDGTHTYLIGRDRVAVIDPGSRAPDHLRAIADDIGTANVEAIILTHDHADHAAGAAELGTRFGAPVRAFADGTLADADRIQTDDGTLHVVHTPGHTPDHVAFDWPAGRAAFVGDLMMGAQWTTLVAPPEGDLSAYLSSLERVRALGQRTLYPAHGPPFADASAAIDAYVEHRAARERQVLAALESGPVDAEILLDAVYRDEVPAALVPAARAALEAYLDHMQRRGLVERRGTIWALRRRGGGDTAGPVS